MNVSKFLSVLADLWMKHAPTVFVHILLFVVVRAWIIDPAYIVEGQPVWNTIKGTLNNVLIELGFQKIELGYVIAALILVYLNIIQWIAFFISRLRVFFIAIRESFNPHLIAHAGNVLRTPPDIFLTLKETDKLVDAHLRQFHERGEPEPYQWLEKQIQTWERYYGLSLLALFGTLLWIWYGTPGAKSAQHVLYLVVVIVLMAILSRYKVRQNWVRRRDSIRFAALYEKQQDQELTKEPGKLRFLREEKLRQDADYYRTYRRHPATIIRTLTSRLPTSLRKRINRYISYPPRNEASDWDLLRSQILKQYEEEYSPPQALNVEKFRQHFSGLLECEGTGLCLLINPDSGLAPCASGGGSVYSFATRAHDGHEPSILYQCFEQDGKLARKLMVPDYGNNWGFLCVVGEHPIELLVQHKFPKGPLEHDWWRLTGNRLDTTNWSAEMFEKNGTEVCGINACCSQPMMPGNSYLYRCKTYTGIEVVTAFQCFLVDGTDHVVLAWKILDVFYERPVPQTCLPWWKPMAWHGLLRETGTISD